MGTEGRSDFGIENEERARRSLVVTGIVGNRLHDRILIQNELIRQKMWNPEKQWRPEEVRSMGQREGNRSILIVCKSKEEADRIYIKNAAHREVEVRLRRYRTKENWMKERARRQRRRERRQQFEQRLSFDTNPILTETAKRERK